MCLKEWDIKYVCPFSNLTDKQPNSHRYSYNDPSPFDVTHDFQCGTGFKVGKHESGNDC